MKRLGLILLFLPIFSAAEVVVPIDSVQNSVNIRMAADASSEIVGKLKQGDWLTLVETTAGWHEVEIAGGATGFISADWTRILGEPPPAAASVAAERTDTVIGAPAAGADAGTAAGKSGDAEARAPEPDETETPVVADATGAEASDDAPAALEVVAAGSTEAAAAKTLADLSEAVTVSGQAGTAPRPVAGAETDAASTAPEPGDAETVAAEGGEAETVVAATVEETPADLSVVDTSADTDDGDALPASSPAVASAIVAPAVVTTGSERGPQGPPGPAGPPGPPGAAGAGTVEGAVDFLVKFTAPTIGGTSQVYDDGNFVGIGTTEPKQRLEVNGNIQINEQNSSVAGLMITQSGGETGYIMHNRASTLTIGAGSVDRITIDREGNVGIGVARPSRPLELANGAHVTAGGVWTNSSSRARKENIETLSPEEALKALAALEPVRFNYRNDRDEDYVGFIAEDVPDLVAMQDRDSLSAMDIVAVLTRVVQEQQKKIEALEAKLEQR